jgi:hypothetical protein
MWGRGKVRTCACIQGHKAVCCLIMGIRSHIHLVVRGVPNQIPLYVEWYHKYRFCRVLTVVCITRISDFWGALYIILYSEKQENRNQMFPFSGEGETFSCVP